MNILYSHYLERVVRIRVKWRYPTDLLVSLLWYHLTFDKGFLLGSKHERNLTIFEYIPQVILFGKQFAAFFLY